MKEVELTEDIRKYEKKAFFGFTLRQGLGLLTASIIGLGINFGFTFIPDTAKGFLALICSFIPILIVFIKPYNMHFEQFAKKKLENIKLIILIMNAQKIFKQKKFQQKN